jgi:hypothetical protein
MREKTNVSLSGSTAGQSAIVKVVNAMKQLRKATEPDYESDQCLESLKRVDNTYAEEKAARVDIVKAMLEHNFPGESLKKSFLIKRVCLFSISVHIFFPVNKLCCNN